MRLKELREERELTQSDVAKGIGTNQRGISRWENEENQPPADMIIKLADYFNVSTDYLLGRTDDFGSAIPTTSLAYSTEEQRLIESYRGLGKPLKDLLWGFIETWQNNTIQKTGENK